MSAEQREELKRLADHYAIQARCDGQRGKELDSEHTTTARDALHAAIDAAIPGAQAPAIEPVATAVFRLIDAVGLALAGNEFELGRDRLFAAYKEVKALDPLGVVLEERKKAEPPINAAEQEPQ